MKYSYTKTSDFYPWIMLKQQDLLKIRRIKLCFERKKGLTKDCCLSTIFAWKVSVNLCSTFSYHDLFLHISQVTFNFYGWVLTQSETFCFFQRINQSWEQLLII